MQNFSQNARTGQMGSAVVEHLPHYPRVRGSSLDDTGREKMAKSISKITASELNTIAIEQHILDTNAAK